MNGYQPQPLTAEVAFVVFALEQSRLARVASIGVRVPVADANLRWKVIEHDTKPRLTWKLLAPPQHQSTEPKSRIVFEASLSGPRPSLRFFAAPHPLPMVPSARRESRKPHPLQLLQTRRRR